MIGKLPMKNKNIIEKLSEYDGFKHTTIPIYEIPYLFTPFDKITTKKTESTLKRSIENGEFVSLKAETGSGKTCVASFVFLMLQTRYFPIIISPLMENVEKVCTSPEEFARFILAQTYYNVQSFGVIDKKTKAIAKEAMALKISYAEGKKTGIGGQIKGTLSFVPFLASLEPQLSIDIEEFTKTALEEKIYNTQRIACIKQLCETIEAYGTKPIFLLDDTDKFLKRPDIDLSAVVAPFFGRILPALVKIDYPIIVATHEYYDGFPAYRDAEKNCFNKVITIPKIDKAGLDAVLQKRIKAVGSRAKLDEVFEADAVKTIYDYYCREPILRRTMLLCQDCVEKAISEGKEKITNSLVTLTILESESNAH
jgi:hypothetical protein